jgi:predicted NAD/FAD-binding protein
MFDQQIAIIGGGVSGLSTAYELAKQAKEHNVKTKIVIYEKKDSLGGNAQTVAFSLGYKKGIQSEDNNIEYIRWSDLGVNDINLSVYTTVKEVMQDIGYLNKDNTNLLPLENSECYFTLDGHTALTDDSDLQRGVIDPRYSLQHIENGYLQKFIELLNDAAIKAIYPDGLNNEENLDITCADFFDGCAQNPKKTLEPFAKIKDWYKESDWNNKEWLKKASKWVIQLRDNVFYSRISAMYFANDAGPENMLLAAPFKYYMIQEGINNSKVKDEADRRYFVGGAQRWLEFLADYLTDQDKINNKWVDISIINQQASVSVTDEGLQVFSGSSLSDYDYTIVTTHANDALRLLTFEQKDTDQEANIVEILSKISYTTSVAVCHTWSGLLPPNRNLWRTYNVIIRKGVSLKPYSMTYVCNRHQNDAANSEYDCSGLPQFFVTLNPQLPIPDDAIVRKVPKSLIPSHLHNILPKQTLDTLDNLNTESDEKAITYFHHNLIDKPCFLAQRALKKYHDTKPTLYFGGGWSNGSGLHEECWLQSRDIANRIFKNRQCR